MLLLCLGMSATARAQSTDVATAAELFREGRDALEARSYGVACPKLAESLRLDAHVGTAISLAQCEAAIHRVGSARVHWQQAVDLARAAGDSREAFAEAQLAAIDPRVPRLTLRLGVDAGPDAVVKRDDVVVDVPSLGLALPVEVGSHMMTTTAPGHEPSTVTVDLGEGDHREVVLQLGPVVAPPAPEPPIPMPSSAPARQEMPADVAPPPRSIPRSIGFISGGLGLAAVAVGTVAGVVALGDYKRADDLCPQHRGCSDAAITSRNQADTSAWVADIGIAVGVVAVAVSAYVLFLAPRASSSPAVRASGRGVVVSF